MDPASKKLMMYAQALKPNQSAADHQQINRNPPVLNKSLTTKVESAGAVKTKPAATTTTLMGQTKPYFSRAAPQDGQSSSSSKQLNKSQVWDCGSSLYDSFELNSLNLQLDRAINTSTRTLSLPHLPVPDDQSLPVMTLAKHRPAMSRKLNKVSKSVKKILRTVFGSSNAVNNHTTSDTFTRSKTSSEKMIKKDSFNIYDGSKSMRTLTTIPEMQEINENPKFSPDATPAVRRVVSERFTPAAVRV